MNLPTAFVFSTIVLHGTYIHRTVNFGNWQSQTFAEYPVSSNFVYRNDFGWICTVTMIFVILFVFLCNLVTSTVRRGGVLGGLL